MHSPSDSSAPAQAPPAPVSGSHLGMPAKLGLAALAVCALAALFWPRGDATFKEPGGSLYDANRPVAPIRPPLRPVPLGHFLAPLLPACLQEIPALQRLTRDFAGHEDFSVLMVAVS